MHRTDIEHKDTNHKLRSFNCHCHSRKSHCKTSSIEIQFENNKSLFYYSPQKFVLKHTILNISLAGDVTKGADSCCDGQDFAAPLDVINEHNVESN